VDDLAITGATFVRLEVLTDPRGSLVELYRRSRSAAASGMVQANLSRSVAGVIRGMHFHRLQSDLWIPVAGRATAALFDLRQGSPTQGQRLNLELVADDPAALGIPAGVAHGFAATEPFSLLYLVDREYTGDDEWGVAWDDPGLGIDWPVRSPILSDRDRANPSLDAVLADPPRFA
jgi:dTDP-4-dehydrorhamnose 3,5-epimerase